MHKYNSPHCSVIILATADMPSQTKPAGRLCWFNLLVKYAADTDRQAIKYTTVPLGNIAGNVPVSQTTSSPKFLVS